MFYWDGGLRLAKADLAVDFRRRQPRAFISHAHTDHIARHQYALCTPQTAALYQLRLGRRPTLEMPYYRPIQWGGLRLTTYPAGHCLGSAMLLAEDGDRSLLYTGDFKLSESATAGRAELPRADILVIECTYGHPQYRLPPRKSVIDQLCRLVRRTLAEDRIPVIEAYALGKAQEVIRILASAGFAVLEHPAIKPLSDVYESFGVKLGRRGVCRGGVEPGHVLVVPPRTRRLAPGAREVRVAVTGWALDPGAKYWLGVDHALPLSDHADYDELLEAVRRVAARRVYCMHGQEGFVDRLRDAGFDAHMLGRPSQRRIF
ncbi:MAG: MBL fold metallo-hydrolase RNA specificity domain-containing protein [Thermoguttaceae bacterium]